MSEQLHFDFMSAPYQCEHCFHTASKPYLVERFVEQGKTRLFVFCDELCSHAYYLKQLRETGI